MAMGLTLDRRLTELLQTARTDAGLTQRDVARQLGNTQSYVARVESGERRITVHDLLRLCRAIGCDPCEIISRLEADLSSSQG